MRNLCSLRPRAPLMLLSQLLPQLRRALPKAAPPSSRHQPGLKIQR